MTTDPRRLIAEVRALPDARCTCPLGFVAQCEIHYRTDRSLLCELADALAARLEVAELADAWEAHGPPATTPDHELTGRELALAKAVRRLRAGAEGRTSVAESSESEAHVTKLDAGPRDRRAPALCPSSIADSGAMLPVHEDNDPDDDDLVPPGYFDRIRVTVEPASPDRCATCAGKVAPHWPFCAHCGARLRKS